MMLQAKVRRVVAECEQEIIMTIMGCAEERTGLGSEVLIVSNLVGGNLECGGIIGSRVNRDLGVGLAQWDLDEILPGQHRGIDQRGQGNGSKLNGVAALAGGVERRAILPSRG